MSIFDSGVQDYVHSQATVDVFFPIDKNGVPYINCSMCYYFREQTKKCALNNEVCAFPNKYVGDGCPLHPVIEDGEEENFINGLEIE